MKNNMNAYLCVMNKSDYKQFSIFAGIKIY
jgi:hypothetical protein